MTEFKITQARDFDAVLPSGLPMLSIRQRKPVGKTVRLCAVGDIGLSGRARLSAERLGYGRMLEEVAPFLRTAQCVLGNLEFPIVEGDSPNPLFKCDPRVAEVLRNAGFNIIHLANNHMLDHGQRGFADTLRWVSACGMRPLGAGLSTSEAKGIVICEPSGLKVGFLGCGRTLVRQAPAGPAFWEFSGAELVESVKSLRPLVDILVVSIHAGFMYVDYPKPEHKGMAEDLMRAGAHLVLMHHAHVLQGLEATSGGAVCCFSLGNFILDWQEGNVQVSVVHELQEEGGIFLAEVDSAGVALAGFLPTMITDECRVVWATGERGARILERLRRISADLTGDYARLFAQQRAERNTGAVLRVLGFHLRRGHFSYVVSELLKLRFEHIRMLLSWAARRLVGKP
jgi:poly-gamma-glutamate synthesis protein (capsule biosynthesis protein)